MTRARTLSVADLMHEHGLALLRFAYLLSGDRQSAEDLLQDVLLQLHRKFPAGLTVDRPLAYARRSLANTNVSRHRRAWNAEIAVEDIPDRPDPRAADPGSAADRDELWQALRRLPERQRTVVVLRFYADASDDEIAATLGCRRGTVRSLASRAMAVLRADDAIGTRVDGGTR